MYFPMRRSLPPRSEPDNTFWTDSTVTSDTTTFWDYGAKLFGGVAGFRYPIILKRDS